MAPVMRRNIQFKRASEEDSTPLAELRWDARAEGGETPAVSREDFLSACVAFLRQGWANGSHTLFIAAQGRLIVALLSIHRVRLFPRPAKPDDYMGVITENYTRPDFRNRGIGRALLQDGIVWSRKNDFELLVVYPSERAIPFYQRAGFSQENDVMELRLREYYSQEWTKGS